MALESGPQRSRSEFGLYPNSVRLSELAAEGARHFGMSDATPYCHGRAFPILSRLIGWFVDIPAAMRIIK